MNKATRKEIFTVIGQIKDVNGRHRFVPESSRYFQSCLDRLPIGKRGSATFYEHVATRSEAQLAYHFVLMGYIAEYTGFTKDECHDGIMRLKFGTKKIKIGKNIVEVRKSISTKAKMSKSDVVELISYDLELCRELNINVPTAEELGYVK